MRKLTLAAIAALITATASAQAIGENLQENRQAVEREAAKAPFHSNGILDNLFVGVGGGVNAVLDNGSFNIGGPAVRADIGKWLTPYTAVRLGWQGLSNRATDTANGWFAGQDPFGFHFVHIDWMWDATATVLGYNPRRIVNARPFVKAGVILTSYDGKADAEMGAGPGLNLSFRLTRRLAVEAEATYLLAREEAYRGAGRIVAFPSATAGVTCAIGKTDFDRHTTTVREVKVPADCNHEAVIKALKDEIAALRARKADTVTVSVNRTVGTEMAVYFTVDKWDLSVRENWHLKDLVDILPADASLTIVGHADKETGSASRNAFLAEQRVKTVEDALRSLGFRGTVKADHKGDRENPFGEPFQKNRCVTIKVTIR